MCDHMHSISSQSYINPVSLILLRDHLVSRLLTHSDLFHRHQHTPKSGSTRQTQFPWSRFGRPYHSPSPFTETTIPPRHISQTGTRTSRYPTTLLGTLTTLLNVPRDKCKLKLASSTGSGCSQQDLSVCHLALPVLPSLVVLLFLGLFSACQSCICINS
jgi:hypothetical protein